LTVIASALTVRVELTTPTIVCRTNSRRNASEMSSA